MPSNMSNGYDAAVKTDATTSKSQGSATFKAEATASVTASVSESSNVNNSFSFNLSLASVSISSTTKDSTNIGASFSVSYGLPNALSLYITPPKLKAWLKNVSTKGCLTFKYTDVIHHRGESLSLRTNVAGIDDAIGLIQYGTQPVTLAGGDRIDITASDLKSNAAKSSLKMIQAAMTTTAVVQTGTLAAGAAIVRGQKGSTGFRGNATDSISSSLGISTGALALAVIPVIAMFAASKKTTDYGQQDLKGPNGSGTPNVSGILMDACGVSDAGKITVKGLEIILNARDPMIKTGGSSLEFNKNGSINMEGVNCSLETNAEGGQAGVFLQSSSITVNAGTKTHMLINATAIELKNDSHSVNLSAAAFKADGMTITPGGASIPGGTVANGGVVNFV